MRKRGFIFVLAGTPALAYTLYVVNEIRKSPFGYELGSVAFPMPTHLRLIGIFGLLSTLFGLLLALWDLIRWFRTR